MHLKHPMRDGHPPSWAHGYGFDQFGPFAEVYVGDATLVMRWISPGAFIMGSPETEAGRFDREVQHKVTLTQGFWMADTAVTQALWTAVMGENPSKFKHLERPVETVSWDDAQAFIKRLNGVLPELEAGLPTEAQWEYACRAGTTTATYAGDIEVIGLHNAPVLHPIAWYGGNSGVDFDLSEGRDSSGWDEKQFPHTKTGTRIVRQKAPNGWGLYDMLGNVREWCSDRYADSTVDVIDPVGPAKGPHRVFRGGSWGDDARSARAACRYWLAPSYRNIWLGFRLSRGPEPCGAGATTELGRAKPRRLSKRAPGAERRGRGAAAESKFRSEPPKVAAEVRPSRRS